MVHCYFDQATSFSTRFCSFHLSLSPGCFVARARKGNGIRVCGSRRRILSPYPQPPSCGVPRFSVFFFLPFFGSAARKIYIAGQIEIIHYLNSVATTVRDLLVDVAPDSPL